ncbi:MAG: diguanylate cyclase [Deltaproteobacteria bacterium]
MTRAVSSSFRPPSSPASSRGPGSPTSSLVVAPASPSPLNVLVVDDDGSNRLLAVRWLERAGLTTCEADSGEDALRQLRNAPERVGAVLLDVMMPGMNGYAVLEQLQAEDALREVPVVLLSGHAQPESDVLYGLRHGAVDHIAKPFRGPILAAKLQSLVARRGRQLELGERLRRAEAQATTDPMTALANRRQFDLELKRETAFTTRHRAPLALILVDIDNLKIINDALGHSAGDRAIIWTAESLRNAMRCSDRSFRIGGDEFAVLLRGLDRSSGLRAARRFVQAQTRQPLRLDVEEALEVTVSVGVAVADSSNDFDVNELFRRADRALYLAKSHPESRVEAEPEPPA